MVGQSGHSGEFLLAEQRDVLQREGQIARVVDHDARRLRSGPHIAIADGHRVRVGVLERRRVVAALHRELERVPVSLQQRTQRRNAHERGIAVRVDQRRVARRLQLEAEEVLPVRVHLVRAGTPGLDVVDRELLVLLRARHRQHAHLHVRVPRRRGNVELHRLVALLLALVVVVD